MLVALILSVSALTSVSFLADRMHRAFEFDARQLLASDLLIVADQPIPEQFLRQADDRKLGLAQTIVFPSMATGGNLSKLASIKAVSSGYPLRGVLRVAQFNKIGNLEEQDTSSGPSPGAVWVEPALLNNLQVQIGDKLQLGNQQFQITGIIKRELDRGAGFMNFAPRVMISLNDLQGTGLIGLGSRVTYRLLLAGSDVDIAAYQKWATQWIDSQALRGIRIETLENAQPMMRNTLERAEQFLSLVALLTAMIAAVAIALSARRYMLSQADVCAALKCFGATRASILSKQLMTLFSLAVTAAFLGALIGYGIQELLTCLLGNLVPSNLPAISLMPALWSALFTWILLFAFAGPPLLSLAKVSPMRLIRKEFEFVGVSTVWVIILALMSCAGLIWIAARDWKLALWVGVSFIGAIIIFAALSKSILWLLAKIQSERFAIRFALTAMSRRSSFAVMQITALGVAIMAILMILLLRQDLLSAWQGNIPPDAPNRFMINIQEEQKSAIASLLTANGVTKPVFSPMIRGRLIQINDKDIGPDDFQDENAKRLIDREFNLSYTTQLPQGNRIIAGSWLGGSAPQISIESGLAKTLKLKIGDQMTFEVAGEKVSAPITSLRKLDWSSMRVNFFVIMPPELLSGMPQSWITSYYQSPQDNHLDFQLSQAYPNLTLVDVSASLQQIQDVLNKLSGALALLLGFTLIAAVLVLISSIAATQDERFRNAALLKAIGASRQMLSHIARAELLFIGLVAGLLAGIASGLAAWALGRFVMEIEFNAFRQAILMGLLFGATATILSGYRFQKRIQRATAIECLRES